MQVEIKFLCQKFFLLPLFIILKLAKLKTFNNFYNGDFWSQISLKSLAILIISMRINCLESVVAMHVKAANAWK